MYLVCMACMCGMYFYRTAGIPGKGILSRENGKSTGSFRGELKAAEGREPERVAETGMDQI